MTPRVGGTAWHTPGPWVVGSSVETRLPELPDIPTVEHPRADGSTRYVCRMFGCADSVKAETAANAALIASAPDLLEALRDVMAWVDEDMIHEPGALRDRARARAAIARAEGR